MGPPPPSPRIEGQQNNGVANPPNLNYRKPVRPAASVVSSYASLASAPPPSFARKSTTTSASTSSAAAAAAAAVSSSLNSTSSSSTTRPSATSLDYHRSSSPRGGATNQNLSLSSYRSNSTGSARRYDGGGHGRGSFRGGSGSSSSGGRGLSRYSALSDRYDDDRYTSTVTSSRSAPQTLSLSSELSSTRSGGGRGGGRGSDGHYGTSSSIRSSGAGRFDSSSSRGRGRGRDYMHGGSRARSNSSYRGRGGGSYRDEGGSRGRSSYSDKYDNNYSSFAGENNSVEGRPRSNSFSEDLPPTEPGEYPSSKYRGSGGSDGGRSDSPHPPASGYGGGRRPYGSFASDNASPDGRPMDDDDNYYHSAGSKRRREEGEQEEPVRRPGREIHESANSSAREEGEESTTSPLAADTNGRPGDSLTGPLPADDDGHDRWKSSGPPRDSPLSSRRPFNGGSNYDDVVDNYRDSSSGRGRGRGRGGRGSFRSGRGGRGDYSRSDYSSLSREYGGRYSSDRRLSISASSDRPTRGPEPSPRSLPQYSDLASTSSSSWRRVEGGGASDDIPPRSSPSATGDWRKPPPPASTAPRVISSYATLATDPPPRPTKPVIIAPKPPPEPQRPETPPPSPGPPSGVTTATIRLLDLEAQMEFAYAKHMMLVKRHKLLEAQYNHLETLPVGVEAFEDDYNKLYGVEDANKDQDKPDEAAPTS